MKKGQSSRLTSLLPLTFIKLTIFSSMARMIRYGISRKVTVGIMFEPTAPGDSAFFLSGDVEMVGGALRWGIQRVGPRKAVRELAEDGGEILIAGSVKRKGKKEGAAGGPRAGQPFTPHGKKERS
ncbi:hypothetical protein [Pseudenhygromyxa sp. WMMC2535]|uniref:hypothetical protein n=1 Tax=Pseudenhygromyxa sp. WMMC2535 TaxID=2712867 RepID=UPI0020D105E7|nr:hypothetical protein [Pseudenhygromyxa sp. WMMC2535]